MKKSIISLITLSIGFVVGASALVAVAAWQSAPGAPTACPDNIPGCNPPINVGASDQVKLGGLSLGTLTLPTAGSIFNASGTSVFNGGVLINGGKLAVADGTQLNCDGCVLASNPNGTDLPGTASWVSTSSLGMTGGANGTNGINGFGGMQVFDSSGTWTAPAGVTKVIVEVWGGGGGYGSQGYNYPGSGGGYGKGFFTVVPGNNYTVNVGAGGYASAGGTSDFGGMISATGGGFGIGSSGGDSSAIIHERGESATIGIHSPGGKGGGPGGGAGGAQISIAMCNGLVPGGGSSVQNSSCADGGVPAHGRVIVWW